MVKMASEAECIEITWKCWGNELVSILAYRMKDFLLNSLSWNMWFMWREFGRFPSVLIGAMELVLSSLYHQLSWTAVIFYELLVSTRFWSFLWEEIYLFINLFIYLLIIYLNIYVIYLLLLFKHPQDLAHSRFLIIVWWANECHRYLN